METTGILVDMWHRRSLDGKPGSYLLWVKDGDGTICLEDVDMRPSFSIVPSKNHMLVERAVSQHDNIYRTEVAYRRPSIYSDDAVPVIRAFMLDERRMDETMREIRLRSPAEVSFAEGDIRTDLQWHYLRNIPPHSPVSVRHSGGKLKSIACAGTCNPDRLKIMAIHPEFSGGLPGKARLNSISINTGSAEFTMAGDEASILRDFQAAVDRENPDVLALYDADYKALPMIGLRARYLGVGLRLGRVPWHTRLYEGRLMKSERVSHWRVNQIRAPGRMVLDLWKDARTDADLKRTDLSLKSVYNAGRRASCDKTGASMVYDMARERLPMFISWSERCMMPVDSVCREKHGFMNASMVNYAMIGSAVIPEDAEFPEGFKTPIVEKLKENGGLVITPEAGLHEDVAIVDFSSLFPRIFVKHNISPETINCRHRECAENGEKVPFLGFHICTKRKGVYPEVFGRVLEERDRVKNMLRTGDPGSNEYRMLDILYRSLKMQLVSPYGYMQFVLNNFRTVDGNRSVPAFGRWYLLKAREMAEDDGFNVIYADTDSLFLQRKGAPREEYQAFCDRVSREFEMELKLEHVCRWVLFLPERPGGTKGLKKKYFASVDGEVLARGLEVRRQDRARITKEVQEKVLEMLASARDRCEFKAMIPAVASYVRGQVSRIMEGNVSAGDLTIIKKLSRRPEEYTAKAHHCIAAESLAASGREVRVGARVEYIITGTGRAVPAGITSEKLPDYDVRSYVDNTVRPIYMLLREFGLKYEDLIPGPKQMTLEMYPEADSECRA